MVNSLRYLWALPATSIGLFFLPLAAPWGGGRVRLVSGVLELHGAPIAWCLRRLTPISASAMTLGHVVIGRDAATLVSTRAHERVHVRQYERWGILFYPAYLSVSLWLWMRGRDPYHCNPFEVQAYAEERKEPEMYS